MNRDGMTPLDGLKAEIDELVEKVSVRDDNFSPVDIAAAFDRVSGLLYKCKARIRELEEDLESEEEKNIDLSNEIEELEERLIPVETWNVPGIDVIRILPPSVLLDEQIVSEFARCMKIGQLHKFLAHLESFK